MLVAGIAATSAESAALVARVVLAESVELAELAVPAELAVLAESAASVVRVVLAVLVELVVLEVLAELAVLVEWAAPVELVEEIACPPCLPGVTTGGNTIPSIAAELPTKTGRRRIALAARLVAILSPGARRAPGNKLAGKVAAWPVAAEGLE